MVLGRAGKLAITLSCLVIGGWSVLQQYYLLSGLFAIPVLMIIGGRLKETIAERIRLRHIASESMKNHGLPSARETLLKMGLDHSVIKRVLSNGSPNSDILIVEYDQNNRVLSKVGQIPLFDGFHISEENYRPRGKNRVQVVVVSGVVAIKKVYRYYTDFCDEALVLNALSGIDGVPKLIGVRIKDRVLYQTFVTGKNIGSLMCQQGASVSIQYQAEVKYPGKGKWHQCGILPPERELAVKAFRAVVNEDFVHALRQLFKNIHSAGVVIGDVKYGNVIMSDGEPFLIDFDSARVYRKNSMQFMIKKESDKDRFCYFFGPS